MHPVLATAILTFATLIAAPTFAADDHAGHGAMQATPAATAAMTDGQVKKIDKTGSKVTLAHGPLVNLAMPAMTMAFRVKDIAWLDQMKEGDKIRFMADNVNGVLTVMKFDKVK